MLGLAEGLQHLDGRSAFPLPEPGLRPRIGVEQARLGELGKRPTQARLQDLEEEKGQAEGRLLHRGIELARQRLREGRGVRLQIEERLRLARHARGRIRRKFAPDFIYEGPVDGSHREILLRPYGLSGKVNSRDSSTRERALRAFHRAHVVDSRGELKGRT